MRTVSVDAESAFIIAESFNLASNVLINNFDSTGGKVIVPQIVTLAFAVETYLKCLLAIQNAGMVRAEHTLKGLFSYLNSTNQATVKTYFDQQVANSAFIKKSGRTSIDVIEK